MTELHLRPCTSEDVVAAVPLILASGPDAFAYVFRTKTITESDFLTYAFQTKGGEFSYENHYALMKNQRLVGIGSVFSSKMANGFVLKDGMKIIRFYKLSALAVLIKGLRVEQLIKPPVKKEVCVGHIAIEESQRSNGYGRHLMELLMQMVALSEKGRFVLDVSAKNPRAQALYERMGFLADTYNVSKLKNSIATVPDHTRMRLEIAPAQ